MCVRTTIHFVKGDTNISVYLTYNSVAFFLVSEISFHPTQSALQLVITKYLTTFMVLWNYHSSLRLEMDSFRCRHQSILLFNVTFRNKNSKKFPTGNYSQCKDIPHSQYNYKIFQSNTTHTQSEWPCFRGKRSLVLWNKFLNNTFRVEHMCSRSAKFFHLNTEHSETIKQRTIYTRTYPLYSRVVTHNLKVTHHYHVWHCTRKINAPIIYFTA